MGLVRALEERARGHTKTELPEDIPSCIILCPTATKTSPSACRSYRELSPDALPVLVFGSQLALPLARNALKAGASGFVHAGIKPDQLIYAVTVAEKVSSLHHESCSAT